MFEGRTAALLVALTGFSLGCGGADVPELGYVSGKVTMDGQPLQGVSVQFNPVDGGRAGSGATNEEGEYELQYTSGYEGAVVGPCKVSINTIWPEGEAPDGESDPVPPKYNHKTELAETVEPGDNVFNFDLQSK